MSVSLSHIALLLLKERFFIHIISAQRLRIDVAVKANAEAQFTVPATGGKNHRLIRVEQAVFARPGRLSQFTRL